MLTSSSISRRDEKENGDSASPGAGISGEVAVLLVSVQARGMLPEGDEEGMHRAVALQTGHRSDGGEGLAGLDGHEILAAIHNLCNDVPGAQVDVLELGGETQMHHLRSGKVKRVRGLCKGDSGA